MNGINNQRDPNCERRIEQVALHLNQKINNIYCDINQLKECCNKSYPTTACYRTISGLGEQTNIQVLLTSLQNQICSLSETHSSNEKTDYGLIGEKDSVNIVYYSTGLYITGTTKLYRNGVRQFLNGDYFETGPYEITVLIPLDPEEQLIMDYKIL